MVSRNFSLFSVLLALSILLSFPAKLLYGATTGQGNKNHDRKPNILFIVTDDQRFDTIHALGNNEIHTPTQDALVKRGFVFNNTYCMGGMEPAVCAPSRTMIMTGKSLFHIPKPRGKSYADISLGKSFKKAGYSTLFVGKRSNSFLAGNQEFATVLFHDESPKVRAEQSRWVADQSIQWLQKQSNDEPFFVYLGASVPHDPRLAPPEFRNRYDAEKISLPKNFMPKHPFDNGELKIRDELLAAIPRQEKEMKQHIADYYACITCFDYHIGRVLDYLNQKGKLDNTIVVWTSDQGLAVGGRHGLMGKQNLYEEFKSPLIIAGPGIGNGRSDALVYLFDLYPTLLDIAQLNIPASLEGKSLVPVLHKKVEKVRDHLFAAYRDCQRMIRDRQYKLLYYPKIERYQLFDVLKDPWELHDLAGRPDYSAKQSQLQKELRIKQEFFGDPILKKK